MKVVVAASSPWGRDISAGRTEQGCEDASDFISEQPPVLAAEAPLPKQTQA